MSLLLKFPPKLKIPELFRLLLVGLVLTTPPAWGVPTVEEIQADVREFQQFFRSRFANVALEAYNDGVYALPQYAQRRLTWELLGEFPAYESELVRGRKEWQKKLPDGSTLEQCFAGKPPPSNYPYFFAGTVCTVVGDINQCLATSGAATLDGMSSKMARLEAAFKSPWNGQLMDIDYRDEKMRELYQKGRQFFWAKRGQMNLSCANCHVHNAGNQLRGDVLSAALGHTTGFPAYSTSWSLQGEPMGTLHRQYARCNIRAGTAPLEAQSEEYIALEVYQGILNSGIPLKTPSQRQ